MFSVADRAQLSAHGIALEQACRQMQAFRTGFPPLDIVAPASVENGILRPTDEQVDAYIQAWQNYLNEGHTILKFVPASGAASRMFKDLFAYLDNGEQTPYIHQFLTHKADFAFGAQLEGYEGQDAVHHLLCGMGQIASHFATERAAVPFGTVTSPLGGILHHQPRYARRGIAVCLCFLCFVRGSTYCYRIV